MMTKNQVAVADQLALDISAMLRGQSCYLDQTAARYLTANGERIARREPTIYSSEEAIRSIACRAAIAK